MPPRHGLRPLKAWRYVGIFNSELLICLASVRVGPARQAFWAIWDRRRQELHERTVRGRGGVRLRAGSVQVRDRALSLDVRLREGPGIETICPNGDAYAWTRKQAGIAAEGWVTLGARSHRIRAAAVIDDTAAYFERHTRWRWSAGVGSDHDDTPVAWNLVSGVNDPPTSSERTVWVDGVPREVPAMRLRRRPQRRR